MKQYDVIIFGNGLTINLLSQLKQYIKKEKWYLLNIDDFINTLLTGKAPREEEKLFKILMGKKTSESIKKFNGIKNILKDYYTVYNGNIEFAIGKELFKENPFYEKDIMMIWPVIYNVWFNLLYEYLECCGLKNKIENYYKSIDEIVSQDWYTTNFDYFADDYFEVDHIHGKFEKTLNKFDDAIFKYKNEGEFYFKYIWGHNGFGKYRMVDELKKISGHEDYFDFDFLFNTQKSYNKMLIYGLSFQRSGFMTEEFIKANPKCEDLFGSVIDEHILCRLRVLEEQGRLNNIVVSYYSDYEKEYLEKIFEKFKVGKVGKVEFKHSTSFNFSIN